MDNKTRSILAACMLALLPACDRVQALFSDDAPASKAPPAETKAEVKAETKTVEAPAPVAVKAPAPVVDAPAPVVEPPAPVATPDAAAVAAVAAAPVAGLPCIVGSWDAIEYTAAVRHAIAKDPQLRSMKKTSSGGHITYVVDPPTGSSGAVRATADHLAYGFSGKVEGFGVQLDLDINGNTEATYELPGEGRIVISRPTRNDMKVKAKVKIQGLGSTRKADKVDLDFDGSFVYECSETKLEVWRGTRSADAMVFTRKPSG